MEGAFALVKVNTDREPELAMSYGVQSIPDLRLFKSGEIVDAMVGAQPEPALRAFLRKHCPTESDRLAADGASKLAAGNLPGARASFEAAVAIDERLPAAQLGLARVALAGADAAAVRRHVDAIRLGSDEYQQGQDLLAATALVEGAAAAGAPSALEARLAADAGDLEARFGLGGHAVARGDHEAALESYLAVAQRSPHWQDDAARKAMLVVFSLLGIRHPTSDAYRDKLRRIYL